MLVDVQTNPTGLGSQKGNILTGRLMQEVLVVGHQFQKCFGCYWTPGSISGNMRNQGIISTKDACKPCRMALEDPVISCYMCAVSNKGHLLH